MGCAVFVIGSVAAIWSLREFANEGATTKAFSLAGFAIALYLVCALLSWVDGKYSSAAKESEGA